MTSYNSSICHRSKTSKTPCSASYTEADLVECAICRGYISNTKEMRYPVCPNHRLSDSLLIQPGVGICSEHSQPCSGCQKVGPVLSKLLEHFAYLGVRPCSVCSKLYCVRCIAEYKPIELKPPSEEALGCAVVGCKYPTSTDEIGQCDGCRRFVCPEHIYDTHGGVYFCPMENESSRSQMLCFPPICKNCVDNKSEKK